jgi:hypothetical protein
MLDDGWSWKTKHDFWKSRVGRFARLKASPFASLRSSASGDVLRTAGLPAAFLFPLPRVGAALVFPFPFPLLFVLSFPSCGSFSFVVLSRSRSSLLFPLQVLSYLYLSDSILPVISVLLISFPREKQHPKP